jgi:hypothetical protein
MKTVHAPKRQEDGFTLTIDAPKQRIPVEILKRMRGKVHLDKQEKRSDVKQQLKKGEW